MLNSLYLSAGREYETRNYSFEDVNHFIPEQLATVGFSIYFAELSVCLFEDPLSLNYHTYKEIIKDNL